MFNDPLKLLITAGAFGLVISIWMLGVLFWSLRKSKKIEQVNDRLKLVQSAGHNSLAGGDDEQGRVLRLWRDGKEATTFVPGMEPDRGLMARLERARVDAGLEASVGSLFIGAAVTFAICALAMFLLTGSMLMTLAAPIAASVVFYISITQRISKRQATFERQLVDALDLASRSLRVGHPLVGSFQMIAEEVAAPVGALFGNVCQQQQLGVSLDQALRSVAAASHSDDLKLFATSVVIQLRSGGNLADMMERVANVIRERNRLTRRVRVLTAQTQMSKRVLLSLPFFIFILLNVINPAYMRPLYTTLTGEIIMAVAATGLLIGWIMMNWLSNLEV